MNPYIKNSTGKTMKKQTTRRGTSRKTTTQTRKPPVHKGKQNSQFKLGPFQAVFNDEPLRYRMAIFIAMLLTIIILGVIFIKCSAATQFTTGTAAGVKGIARWIRGRSP